jgi:hypothetical protein
VERGELSAQRLEHAQKLHKELARQRVQHAGAERRAARQRDRGRGRSNPSRRDDES